MLNVFTRCLNSKGTITWLNLQKILEEKLPILNEEDETLVDEKEIIKSLLTDRFYAYSFTATLYKTGIYLLSFYGIEYFAFIMKFLTERPDFPRKIEREIREGIEYFDIDEELCYY